MAQNETKKDFFHKEQVSVLGISLSYKKNNFVKTVYHTYFSEQLTHDSLFSGNCLTDLFKRLRGSIKIDFLKTKKYSLMDRWQKLFQISGICLFFTQHFQFS